MNSKIITVAALFVGLMIAIIMAIQVGQGEFTTVYVTMFLMFSIPILMILGTRSWYILPFAMLAELPAVPLVAGKAVSLAEFGIAVFAGVMMIAIGQGKNKIKIKLNDWWPMLAFSGWVLMIAIINGGGLAILGSSTMGGRKYLTVIVAMLGMMMLSQMIIREKEAKRVCWLIFASLAMSGVYLAGSTLLGRVDYQSAYEFYNWQQGLSYISLGGIFLLFARYAPSRIVKTPWIILVYVVLIAICAYSGKRMAFAACCIIPVVACIWHRQSIFAFFVVVLGVISISGAVLIQNQVTSIPKSLQRVLAFLPADWDWEVEQSTDNIFRDTLNRWAIVNVEKNPVIGKGVSLTADDYRLMSDYVYVSQIKHEDDDVQAFTHIAGKNWHSTWLGLAASFGIPCAFLWVVVQIFVMRRSWKLGRHFELGSWRNTMMAMILSFMVYGVMRSVSSGDVAVLAMGGGLYLGLMSAIKNGMRQDKIESQAQEAQVVS